MSQATIYSSYGNLRGIEAIPVTLKWVFQVAYPITIVGMPGYYGISLVRCLLKPPDYHSSMLGNNQSGHLQI